MKERDLPLGVDVGATRIRVVHASVTEAGPRIRSVAVRDITPPRGGADDAAEAEHLSALVQDAVEELDVKQRRCVTAIGEPDALLRSVCFPKMSAVERERCARFEAQRHVDFPIADAVVRIHPLRSNTRAWTLGIARSAAVRMRVGVLHSAKLKVLSIDHEACALARALPGFDAILDVGYQRANLHVMTDGLPLTLQTFNGGADVTRAIERELCIDEHTAERRKRILGTAGAGERARAALTADIAVLIQNARRERPVSRIALVGNGSRLPRLADDLERATGAMCEMPVSEPLRDGSYPEDVVRSSAPDWTLAAGLALWVQP